MCPLCIASLTMVAAGATSSGGLTALALRRKRFLKPSSAIAVDRPLRRAMLKWRRWRNNNIEQGTARSTFTFTNGASTKYSEAHLKQTKSEETK
jgi:hypothetical protein